MARQKQKWQVGDYFGIPIEDDFLAVGQILGKYDWIGVACLITKMKISSKNLPLYEDIKIDDYSSSYNAQVTSPYDGSILGTSNRSTARNEVYRLYIVFFNKKMQYFVYKRVRK